MGHQPRRNPACALEFRLTQPSVSSGAERLGPVPQLVFKTSTAL